ncbi:MAG: hypothetical protein HY646_13545 [Acidobacteria bacterium]|nr:hypothetical protein [Acidobacteriota bacterium]
MHPGLVWTFQELFQTSLRAAGVYVLVLAVLRLTGKRSVGNFSAFDPLVALMLGEVVDEMIYGDVTLLQGGIAIITIAAMKMLTSWLTYWDHGWDAILEGTPTLIVRNEASAGAVLRTDRARVHITHFQLRIERGIWVIEDFSF